MVYHPRYYKALWKGLIDREGPMCNVMKRAKASGLDLPLKPPRRA